MCFRKFKQAWGRKEEKTLFKNIKHKRNRVLKLRVPHLLSFLQFFEITGNTALRALRDT
jgi:hypothetical protein